MSTAGNGTNYQFKILYALGMFLVVANHVTDGVTNGVGISVLYELFPAYSFHLPLFVFCSGYFYREYAERHIGKYTYKKFLRLMVPMYVWNCVYALFANAMALKSFNYGGSTGIGWNQLIVYPLISGHQYIYNLAAWFVAPLFMLEIAHVVFKRTLSVFKNARIKDAVYIIGMVAAGMLALYLCSIGLNTLWWLALDRMLFLIPFYGLGYIYKKYLESHDTLNNTVYLSITTALAMVVIIFRGGVLEYSIAWCKLQFEPWPYVVSVIGIAFWLRVARILEPVCGRSRIVNLIADNTFSIMTHQFIGFLLVKTMFAIGYRFTTTLFQDFDWTAYHTNIWYYYFPGGLKQVGILYTIAGLAVGIGIQLGLNHINKAIYRLCGENNKRYKIVQVILLTSIVTGACVGAYYCNLQWQAIMSAINAA